MSTKFGVWSAFHNRFRQWREAGAFEALLEVLIAEAAEYGDADLSLASIDVERLINKLKAWRGVAPLRQPPTATSPASTYALR